MVNFANWDAPQYIIAFILVFALIAQLVTHGQPATKTIRVKDGVEVKTSAGALYGVVTFLALLAWGGFFA